MAEDAKQPEDMRAMELIQASGILNPDTTLRDVMALTRSLMETEEAALVAEGKAAAGPKGPKDTLIYKHFIYKRENPLTATP